MSTKPSALLLAPVLIFLVAGCPVQTTGVHDVSSAKTYFQANSLELERVVREISRCKGPGVVSIYPDGRVNRSPQPSPTCPDFNDIAARIRKLDVLWVNVSGDLPYGKLGPMGATFVLSSYGIVGSGRGSAIYYYPNKQTNPFGDSVPLAGMPGHWFFRYL